MAATDFRDVYGPRADDVYGCPDHGRIDGGVYGRYTHVYNACTTVPHHSLRQYNNVNSVLYSDNSSDQLSPI